MYFRDTEVTIHYILYNVLSCIKVFLNCKAVTFVRNMISHSANCKLVKYQIPELMTND